MCGNSPAVTDGPSRSNYGDPVIRRSFRIGLTLGLLGGLAFALIKVFGPRPDPAAGPAPVPTEPWPRLQAERIQVDPIPPAPAPVAKADPVAKAAPIAKAAPAAKKAPAKKKPLVAAKAPAKKKPLVALWVEPKGDVCPTTHPVKAKLASKIFHLPGMLNYQRAKPDRCYRDATAAEADGLRPAKK
jgi:hypothetical protein